MENITHPFTDTDPPMKNKTKSRENLSLFCLERSYYLKCSREKIPKQTHLFHPWTPLFAPYSLISEMQTCLLQKLAGLWGEELSHPWFRRALLAFQTHCLYALSFQRRPALAKEGWTPGQMPVKAHSHRKGNCLWVSVNLLGEFTFGEKLFFLISSAWIQPFHLRQTLFSKISRQPRPERVRWWGWVLGSGNRRSWLASSR